MLQGGAPQVISWFIIPLTIDISPINHSYWSYVHQLSYRFTLYQLRMKDGNGTSTTKPQQTLRIFR